MPDLHRPIGAVALILALASAAPGAEVELGAPFGDHMVVQRDRPIRIWGQAAPGAAVDVRFGPRRVTANAGPDGRWEATLSPFRPVARTSLSATAGEATAEVGDVLVGDVWLCSGQSNMQMTLKDCDGGPAAADAAGKFTNLRLCSVGRRSSPVPEASAEIRWRAAAPESAREFSAVGFYFAAALLADPALEDVPIGVIDSSFGGSMCEAWVPEGGPGGVRPGGPPGVAVRGRAVGVLQRHDRPAGAGPDQGRGVVPGRGERGPAGDLPEAPRGAHRSLAGPVRDARPAVHRDPVAGLGGGLERALLGVDPGGPGGGRPGRLRTRPLRSGSTRPTGSTCTPGRRPRSVGGRPCWPSATCMAGRSSPPVRCSSRRGPRGAHCG